MPRVRFPLALAACLPAGGCLVNSELYEERRAELLAAEQPGGGYAVRFAQVPDCVRIDMEGVALEGPFTFDAYLWPDVRPGYGQFPVVAWPGMFTLFQDEFGYLVAAPTSDPARGSGASTPTSLLDGARHHVALNYGQSGTLTLYLDGARVAEAPLSFGEPGPVLQLGCWDEQGTTFAGAIGEVRLSDSALYGGNFVPSWEPYEVEAATVGLWHLDEGEGDETFDEAGGHDGTVVAASWEHFYLGPEQ